MKLLIVISGLEKGYEGELILDDMVVFKSDLFDYNRKNVSIVFQDLNLINYLNLFDNLQQGYRVKKVKFKEELMEEYLKVFNIGNLNLNQYPQTISKGQQQRIAIIRALLCDAKLILADEPTASIDKKNTRIIIDKLKEVAKQENKMVIIITHDPFVAKECDKVYHLKNKQIT